MVKHNRPISRPLLKAMHRENEIKWATECTNTNFQHFHQQILCYPQWAKIKAKSGWPLTGTIWPGCDIRKIDSVVYWMKRESRSEIDL